MTQSASIKELIAVFEEATRLVTRADNDFVSSTWNDASEAKATLDRITGALGRGELLPRVELELVFAPTGDLQEVSISSGWGDAFTALAKRFDVAAEQTYPHSARFLPET